MKPESPSFPEEVISLSYHFLSPRRLEAVTTVIQALQQDAHLEFLLAVFEVTINDRPLSAGTAPGRSLLRKLLQALDAEDGAMMLYTSPYNHLGSRNGESASSMDSDALDSDPGLDSEFFQEFDADPGGEDDEDELPYWDFELGDRLLEFRELRSIRAFLEHGTGMGAGNSAAQAKRLHDQLLRGLIDESRNFAVWACADVRMPGTPSDTGSGSGEHGIWPAEEVSPWFHGVFWDDLLFVLNPVESTLTVLAVTSA